MPGQLAFSDPVGPSGGLDGTARRDPRQALQIAGTEHQRFLEQQKQRKRNGSYYTPPEVVSGLLDLALDPILESRACEGVEAVKSIRVLDPACGSGNFLVEAASRIQQRLEKLGVESKEASRVAFAECVVGIDIDETAVGLCRDGLYRMSDGFAPPSAVARQVLRADALEIGMPRRALFGDDVPTWTDVLKQTGANDGYDLVVGNPPFLSQLAAETARAEGYASRVLEQFGDAVAGLTDTAVLFLLLSCKIARPEGGVVCLIQPISFLSTRDATSARACLLDACELRSLWTCEEPLFDASVRVCAPLLRRGSGTSRVKLYTGPDFRPVGESAVSGATWSSLLATIKGVPDRALRGQGTIADIAIASADFRDQYYGLRGCVIDRSDADEDRFPRLVTSGLIDPADLLWGKRRTKFDKAPYEYPRVEVAKLESRLQEWAKEQLRPKLMLATQTKVLEVVVDEHGQCIASVPVISVFAKECTDLWHLGALLTCPPVTLIAARRHLGAALSTEALKLSASDVLKLPLPASDDAWSTAAKHFMHACQSHDSDARRSRLLASAQAMCAAFGLQSDEDLLTWWQDRLPRARAPRS